MNTTEFLDIASAICPERPSIIFEGKVSTFADVADRVNRLAAALAALGVEPRTTVGLIQVNAPRCIETYFATAKCAGIYVPLNFRARAAEFTYMINTADMKVLLVGDRYAPIIEEIKGEIPSVQHFITLDSRREGWLHYDDLLEQYAEAEPPYREVEDTDTTVLMYTAGTTGFPKGVMLSYNSFTSFVMANVSPVDPDAEEERNILTVPLYHIAGTQAVMSAIYGGRTLILERQFEATEWMGLVQQWKANRAMMVPTMLKQLMDHADFNKYDLNSLKVITYGAAPMPLEVISHALEVFPNTQFINAYGQTETAATITALAPEDHHIPAGLPPEERQRRLKRLTSVGKPLADVEIRVVDEYGNEVPRGTVGEVVARGTRVMSGYWKDEERTAKTIKGGWIYTGDQGYMDEENYLYLAGRASDMIIRAGENISPEEVENVLYSHPAVDDAAVFGLYDVTWGENVGVAVVLKPGATASEAELIQFCRERLASYKRPEKVFFMQELPRNPMGKVIKRELRNQYGNYPQV
ncbi:MAG: long-chain-fatty-acid--CoA ligase [Chloroflexi bacterium]|nr:long-chain-fatty-acid--CoA ligase [Chloroflexota bacterium]